MDSPNPNQNAPQSAFSRIDAALARLDTATAKAQQARLTTASEMVALEVRNEKLCEAVGEALGQIDGLIARMEKSS